MVIETHNLPEEPSVEQLWIIAYGSSFSHDWEVGKKAQLEGKNIPYKTELEQAYGFYQRIRKAQRLPEE